MHTNQTFNYLTIDSPANLPLPSDMKEKFGDFEWDKVFWSTYGLPAFNSTFNLVGNQLYFEKDPSGKIDLRKEDFTGQVSLTGIITPIKENEVFYLKLELSFCKGSLIDAQLVEHHTQPVAEYKAGFDEYIKGVVKMQKISKSFWFRYFYKPYFYILAWSASALIAIVQFIIGIFAYIVDKMLPIKL